MTPQPVKTQTATFAGGCFWCTESDFAKVPGVLEVVSGYTGGATANPTYRDVCTGKTGHYEAVQVHFDPGRIGYADLLEIYWRTIDPTDAGGQFVDRGTQYRSAIFYHDAAQQRLAEASKRALAQSGRFRRPVATPILPLTDFHPAEDYHQDFHQKDPARYHAYRAGSGRDPLLSAIWGDHAPGAATPPGKE